MFFLLRLFVISAWLGVALSARASTPALTQGLPAQNLSSVGGGVTIDLRQHFGLPGVTGQLVQFDTVLGKFNVEMLPDAAPLSVANFLGYVNSGAYSSSIIHRSVRNFIIQGGGIRYQANPDRSVSLSYIPASAPIMLEYNLPNVRGTLAMARTGELNSATTQWFVNTVDNTSSLGQSNGGGYAVFARVLGTGMSVVDAIAALPIYQLGNAPLGEVPLRDIQQGQTTVLDTNWVVVPSLTAISTYPSGGSTSALTFSVDSSNPSVASASLADSNLTLTPGANAGTATIFVTVTDTNGNTASGSFDVTVALQDQTIDFPAIADRTFGDPAFTLNASASSGLGVTFSIVSGPATIAGSQLMINGAGVVTVRASQGGDANYHAAADVDRTFIVAKAAASIASFGGTNAIYDGTPKSVTVTTAPAGLAVNLTYAGSATAPTDAGTYTLQATINDANYAGSGSGTLVIAKAAQTVTFGALPDVAFGAAPLTLSASASSNLAVSFAVVSGPVTLSGNTLTLAGAGVVTVRATQAGNANYEPATTVERSFTVTANVASWRAEKFTPQELNDPLISGLSADPDGDGLVNLLEYALGLEPKGASTANLPEVATTASEWVYTYTRPRARAELGYAVELSTNLTTWTTANVTHELVATDAVAGTETWRARVPLTTAPNVFFRLKVTTD